jgi:hypothetical protein
MCRAFYMHTGLAKEQRSIWAIGLVQLFEHEPREFLWGGSALLRQLHPTRIRKYLATDDGDQLLNCHGSERDFHWLQGLAGELDVQYLRTFYQTRCDPAWLHVDSNRAVRLQARCE